ncbi:MAG: CBS domain-containing protein [Deltaproteobacteria bacterium]|nr:MAG: CBS domain-containing protein [Deltaproteobacteria bacterium]
MPLPVKSYMSGDPVSIRAEASALEAFDLLVDHGIRHLPVVDARLRVIGVVSIDDLRAALPFEVSTRRTLTPAERSMIQDWRVGELMSHGPDVVQEDASMADAADRMADRRIGCLPVVDGNGKLVGMLSETDALRALASSTRLSELPERHRKEAELRELVVELERERARITARLDRYHATERELSAEAHDQPMDDPERGADLREVRFTEALDALAARRLEAIDRALDHAVQGRLSVCDGCGGPIPLTRLRALPGTTLCVRCARAGEGAPEAEEPFERVPGGRAETGRPELGSTVYTRFGEGKLLRVALYGTCARCGEVEGRHEPIRDVVVCGTDACGEWLDEVCERAVVEIGDREAYVEPSEIRSVPGMPYD